MDRVKRFREYTRQLECCLGNVNRADCCCCGISSALCFMIVEIGRHPGVSAKELAAILRTDKSTISRSVEELVQKEYVERKASVDDRRKVVLNLLPKGEERFRKIESDMNLKFQDILNEIPEEKQEQVIEALRLYIEACAMIEERKCENESCR